jgi:signal transduction histidine kinase
MTILSINIINYVLAIIIFATLVVMVWLWQRLSITASKLDVEIEGLRKWQREHLPTEKWAQFLEHGYTSLNFGIVLIHPDLSCAYLNPAAEVMTSQKLSDARSKRYQQILAFVTQEGKPDIPPADPILRIFEGRQSIDHQKLFLMSNGRPIPVDVSWFPVLNDQQEVLGAVVVLQETSRQKALEEMKIDFVSIVSHELRTPITAIKGYIDILLHEVQLDPEHIEMLRRVYVSNERQLETVESLLNLSRLERGTIPMRPQAFQMEELVSQVVGEVEPQAKAKGLEFKFDYPRFALAKVWADPARVREVVVNLCTNAVKYTDKGWVHVSLEQNQTDMRLSVEDNGPGISAEVQAKLFAKFQRGESALTESKQGMGLGLYITKQFVELMGGKIWIDSEINKGSTFSFTLPLK